MKKRLLLLLLLIAFLLSGSTASAAPFLQDCEPFKSNGEVVKTSVCPCSTDVTKKSYCLNATDYLISKVVESVQIGLISFNQVGSKIYWFIARMVAALSDLLMSGEIWDLIRGNVGEGTGILGGLAKLMGGSNGVLARLVGGSEGLFAVALMLAGLVMLIPLSDNIQLVKADRVFIWFVVLFILFIAGTAQGFDLIEAIEKMRLQAMQVIACAGECGQEDGGEGDAEGSNFADLITIPMLATDEETEIDWAEPLMLPEKFVEEFYPGIEEDDYRFIRVTGGSIQFAGQEISDLVFKGNALKPDIMKDRVRLVSLAAVRTSMGFCASFVTVLFALIYALLAASSLFLIIVFVALLPLGFFEFGGSILLGLIRQYLYVFALSLAAAVLAGLLTATTETVLEGYTDDPSYALYFLGTLILVSVLLLLLLKETWNAATSTPDALKTVTQTIGEMATLRDAEMATAVAESVNSAVTTAAMVGVGLATGGTDTALIAGVGQVAGQSGLMFAALASKERRPHAFKKPPSAGVGEAISTDQDADGNGSAHRPGIWDEQGAARKLAAAVKRPWSGEFEVGDTSAQRKLRALAREQDWDEGQLEHLFEGVRQATQSGPTGQGESVVDVVDKVLAGRGTFQHVRGDVRSQAIRQAVLMASGVRLRPPEDDESVSLSMVRELVKSPSNSNPHLEALREMVNGCSLSPDLLQELRGHNSRTVPSVLPPGWEDWGGQATSFGGHIFRNQGEELRYKHDLDTGKPIWHYSTEVPETLARSSGLTVHRSGAKKAMEGAWMRRVSGGAYILNWAVSGNAESDDEGGADIPTASQGVDP